jgi:hypothetical protein
MIGRNVFMVVALAVVIGVSCSKVASESVDDAHAITEIIFQIYPMVKWR